MNRLKKALALLLAFLLLAGCARSEGLSSSAGPSLEVSATEESAVSPDEATKLDQLALLYEKYCAGRALSPGETVDADGWLAFGLLYQNGLLDPYWNVRYERWEVPVTVFEGVNRYFFQNLSELSQWDREQSILCSGDAGEVDLGFSLVREGAQRLDDGSIEVTYRRVSGEQTLTPVTYRFRPYTLEEFPDSLEGICQPGETLYLFVSVTQRPDLLPVVQPQTIEIATVEELLSAARRINQGGYESRYDNYLLTADIDLAGVEWTPMGLNNRMLDFAYETERDPNVWGFNGTFDGQGHTIYNLTITEEQGAAFLAGKERNFPDRELQGTAFFYRVGAEGVVKDLRMENADIAVPGDGVYSAAAILAVECMGRLENVSVQGRVRGGSDVGGLVGSLSGAFAYFRDEEYGDTGRAENCTAEVEVTGFSSVGALAGSLHYGTLTNCAAKGTVTAIPDQTSEGRMPGGIGGMVGHSVAGRAFDSGASVYVSTQAPSQWVGGFGGYWQSGGVFSCRVDGQKLGGWEPVGFFYQNDPEGQQEPEVEVR